MSRSTISTFQLFERFPDQEAARIYLEGRLWPNGPVCPRCGNSALLTRPNGFYRCNPCGKFTFSVREGTIFGRSKIPLHAVLQALNAEDLANVAALIATGERPAQAARMIEGSKLSR